MMHDEAQTAAALCQRIENAYKFECEAGPLKNCVEWQELRRIILAQPESHQSLYEQVEGVLTNRLKSALQSGEKINAPDWVADLAACLALAVTMSEFGDEKRLRPFAHEKLDEFIDQRLAELR